MTRREDIRDVSMQRGAANVTVGSFDAERNTVDVVFTTGATVRRFGWNGPYNEELVVDPKSIRMGRLNAGAPFLNTHATYQVSSVLGSVVPGSAKIQDGRGIATIQLTRRADAAGVVQDIRDGVLRNVSVGYRLHQVQKTEATSDNIEHWRVTDWEPMEISAVPIPADPGAQVRKEDASGQPCIFVMDVNDEEKRQVEPQPVVDANAAARMRMLALEHGSL